MPVTDPRLSTKLGLALGGGGALGAAHVGVLQVLEERGLRPSIVVGTSAGAIVGAAYAGGMDLAEIERLVVNAGWGDVAELALSPGLGLFDMTALRATIERTAGREVLIEELPLRFAAVAADLSTREAVVLDRGPVAEAIAASSSVPGIFRPAALGGRILVDGGVVRNLPIETVLAMGADHVIAVRLAPEWDGLPSLRTSTHVHEFEIRRDVTVIRPRLGTRSQWVVKDLATLVALGREAAEAALDALGPLDSRAAKVSALRRWAERVKRRAARRRY